MISPYSVFLFSIFDFRFLVLVLFVLLFLFHPTIQDLHCYFRPYHLPAFSHDTPRPVQGYVFMPRCTFELELSKRYLFVSQHAYPFELLFLCGLVSIFLSRLFSLLSGPPHWALDYVLSRVGVVTSSTITGASADHFNVIISSGLRKFSIRLKIPCKICVNTYQVKRATCIRTRLRMANVCPGMSLKSRQIFVIHKYKSV